MDDYTVSSLSESKNEWVVRLVNILTPLVNEGFLSIFKESEKLCQENDEYDKYLMTFQNFLSRVPKWNNDIVKKETSRIVEKSQCKYLDEVKFKKPIFKIPINLSRSFSLSMLL